MSAKHHRMGEDFEPRHDQSQYGHPKSERAKAKKAKHWLEKHEPVHPSKNVFQPPIAYKATFGDKAAHRYDSTQLCPKLLPVDWQEFRGCKRRDMDRRIKRWNKEVYLDPFHREGACDGPMLRPYKDD